MTVRRRALPVVIAAGILGPAATAHAQVFDALADVATAHLTPAPLVPIKLPKRLDPLVSLGASALTSKPHAYTLTFNRPGRNTPRLILQRGVRRSIAQIHRERGKGLDRVRRVRVRGHKGELRMARYDPSLDLVWPEGGQIYELLGSSRHVFSARDLQAAARSLDPMTGEFLGGTAEGDQSVVAVMTKHTITLLIDWGANCTTPGTSFVTPRGGNGLGQLLPIRGGACSAVDLPSATQEPSWSNQVSGTVSAGGAHVAYRAHGTIHGDVCDTGNQSLALTPAPPPLP